VTVGVGTYRKIFTGAYLLTGFEMTSSDRHIGLR
jgi:hypothetical protein